MHWRSDRQLSNATLEHVNVTVTDPQQTAEMICRLFGWRIRWRGTAIHGGHTVHVGSDDAYLAVYASGKPAKDGGPSYHAKGGLNHIGIVVDDLDATEARVKQAGLTPHSHSDYEPGRRFYFHDTDGIEFEVVSYARPTDSAPL